MAGSNSNTATETKHSLSLEERERLDNAHRKLTQISGVLDCLLILAVKHDQDDLGLSGGSLIATLDLAIGAVEETKELLAGVNA